MNERKSIDIEPGEFSFFAYEISKKVINLFRHTPTVQREENGAVQFWKIRIIFRIKFHKFRLGLMVVRKYACQQEEERKRDINCTDASGTIDYFRAFQGHSGRNFIDPSLQDNVIIQSGFFQHSYHIRCVLNLHSINNNGQYSFLPIDPRNKGHQYLATIDFIKSRRAQYLHSVWKKHQDAVFWVDINLAIKRDWHSIKLDRMQSFFKEHFQLNVFQKLWDWRLEKFYMRNHTCLLDHHQRSHYDTITIGPEGKFNWVLQLINSQKVRLFDSLEEKFNMKRFSQPTQPIPKPIRNRSRQPEDTQSVIVVKGETSRSHEIDEKVFHEKLCASDGSGQLEITLSVIEARNLSENTRVVQIHDGSRQPWWV